MSEPDRGPTDLHTYTGHCHCGQVTFAFRCEPIERAGRCNCSMCIRLGATMSPTFIPRERMQILTGADKLRTYRPGEEIDFTFCSTCGVFTFVGPVKEDGMYRINLGCVDELDPHGLEIRYFDGKNLL